jgi:hypothetical protein
LRQTVLRGFEIRLTEDVSIRVRRCWNSGDKEVVEVSLEGGGDVLYASTSACLTPIQASSLSYYLQHEAHIPLEAN